MKLQKKLKNHGFYDDYFMNTNFINFKNFDKYYKILKKNLALINIKIYVLALFEKSIINKKIKVF